jgi:hypothetical protein
MSVELANIAREIDGAWYISMAQQQTTTTRLTVEVASRTFEVSIKPRAKYERPTQSKRVRIHVRDFLNIFSEMLSRDSVGHIRLSHLEVMPRHAAASSQHAHLRFAGKRPDEYLIVP